MGCTYTGASTKKALHASEAPSGKQRVACYSSRQVRTNSAKAPFKTTPLFGGFNMPDSPAFTRLQWRFICTSIPWSWHVACVTPPAKETRGVNVLSGRITTRQPKKVFTRYPKQAHKTERRVMAAVAAGGWACSVGAQSKTSGVAAIRLLGAVQHKAATRSGKNKRAGTAHRCSGPSNFKGAQGQKSELSLGGHPPQSPSHPTCRSSPPAWQTAPWQRYRCRQRRRTGCRSAGRR